MDFGIAKSEDSSVRTKTGFLVGSPAYVSPEQLSGTALDGRTDVYSLGTTLFELLCGRLPFRSRGIEDLARRLDDDAPPLSGSTSPTRTRSSSGSSARPSPATGATATTRRGCATRCGRTSREVPFPRCPRRPARPPTDGSARVALVAALALAAAVVAILLAR